MQDMAPGDTHEVRYVKVQISLFCQKTNYIDEFLMSS